jgi:hypothetical protein
MAVKIDIKWADNTADLTKALREGTDAIVATKAGADKLVQSFSGDKLIAAAHRMVAAINEVGGAEKLTNAERDRTNALLDKAIQKYTALGQEAPTAMKALEAETRRVEDATKKLAPATDSWGSSLGKVKDVIGALGVGLSIGAVVGFTKSIVSSTLDAAGALVDLSNKTGLSTETLQRMQFVAKQSGTDMGAFADAAFKMGVNVTEGTKKARDAAQDLGLNWQTLRNASPDQQFDMVVKALEAMVDPQRRNADAVALFGKGAKEVLPAIVDGYTKVAKEATVAGDAQVKAWDAAGDAWDRFKTRMSTGIIQQLGNQLLLFEATAKLTDAEKAFILQTLEGEKTIEHYNEALIAAAAAKAKLAATSGPGPDHRAGDISLPSDKPVVTSTFADDLRAAEAGYRALTAAQRADIAAAIALGESTDTIINRLGISEGVLKQATKAFEEHKAAVAKAQAAQEAWNKNAVEVESVGADVEATILTMDGAIVPWAEHLLKSGLSAKQVAEYYGTTEAQMAALGRRIVAETAALKILLDIREKWEAGTTKLNETLLVVNSTELITIKQHLDLAASMKMVEQSVPPTVAGFYGAADALEHVGLKSTELRDLQVKLALQTKSLGDVFTDSFAALPSIMAKAFEGGGGVEGAAKAYGATLANDVVTSYADEMKKAGHPLTKGQTAAIGAGTAGASTVGGLTGDATAAMIGGAAASIGGAALAASAAGTAMAAAGVGGAIALGAATMGIGAAAVGVYMLAKHFLTVSQNEKDARVEFAKLQDLYGSLPATIDAVGQAYALLGYNGDQARSAINQALDATHKSAAEEDAALRPIMAVLAAAAESTANVKTGVDAVTAAGQAFGGTVPDQFKAAVRELANMKGVTDEEKAALLSLSADVKPNFEQLTQTAAKYGVTLEGLGKSFQQANIEGRAKDIAGDFDALVKAGGDAGGILAGMSDEISNLVNDSARFGTAIPENMRPLIDELLRAGKLTDENGNKLEDVSNITFEATPIDDSMTKLADAIDKLTTSLQGLAKLQIPPVVVPVTYVTSNAPAGAPATPPVPAFATGSGGFQDFGSGTLAVLHGREAVITEGQALRGDYTVSSAGSAGPAAASQTVQITFAISTLDAADFQDVVEQKVFPALVNQLRRGRGLTAMRDVLA